MTPDGRIAAHAADAGLMIAGIAPVLPADGLAAGLRTLVLLAPDEPGFWTRFRAAPEYDDGRADPLDRWSRRVIGDIAGACGGTAIFPFDGPPYFPFYNWAIRSGRAFASPVTLLVHDVAGLFISFRGAIALTEPVSQPPAANPCGSCAAQPCRAACPAAALTPSGYDVARCHDWLDTAPGRSCMAGGCLTRRACPVGAERRGEEQSAYHMQRFHPA